MNPKMLALLVLIKIAASESLKPKSLKTTGNGACIPKLLPHVKKSVQKRGLVLEGKERIIHRSAVYQTSLARKLLKCEEWSFKLINLA